MRFRSLYRVQALAIARSHELRGNTMMALIWAGVARAHERTTELIESPYHVVRFPVHRPGMEIRVLWRRKDTIIPRVYRLNVQ